MNLFSKKTSHFSTMLNFANSTFFWIHVWFDFKCRDSNHRQNLSFCMSIFDMHFQIQLWLRLEFTNRTPEDVVPVMNLPHVTLHASRRGRLVRASVAQKLATLAPCSVFFQLSRLGKAFSTSFTTVHLFVHREDVVPDDCGDVVRAAAPWANVKSSGYSFWVSLHPVPV